MGRWCPTTATSGSAPPSSCGPRTRRPPVRCCHLPGTPSWTCTVGRSAGGGDPWALRSAYSTDNGHYVNYRGFRRKDGSLRRGKRSYPGQCQLLICTSCGSGEPVPVSSSDFRLIRKVAHLV